MLFRMSHRPREALLVSATFSKPEQLGPLRNPALDEMRRSLRSRIQLPDPQAAKRKSPPNLVLIKNPRKTGQNRLLNMAFFKPDSKYGKEKKENYFSGEMCMNSSLVEIASPGR